ncbi:hypothetical protein ID875_27190 [Streptomyces globisporus]|uniref:DUF4346 domain-containing protein n=1 Tax=Streptomyces globisporus TaxID=1908 RepID=A0A927GPX9_STRGL|nr:hypothetical protein [Streptomyces globisporus]
MVAEFRRRLVLVDLRGCTDEERLAAALDEQPYPRPAGEEEPGTAAGSWRRSSPGAGRAWCAWPLAGGAGCWGGGDRLLRRDRGDGPAAHRPAALRGGLHGVPRAHRPQRGGPAARRDPARTARPGELSHAGYLGAELAKAEAAARLGLHYVQDRPLTAR